MIATWLTVISIILNNEETIYSQLDKKSSEWLAKRSLDPDIDLSDFVLLLETTVKKYLVTNVSNEWKCLTPDQKSVQSFSTVSGYLASELLKIKSRDSPSKKDKSQGSC